MSGTAIETAIDTRGAELPRSPAYNSHATSFRTCQIKRYTQPWFSAANRGWLQLRLENATQDTLDVRGGMRPKFILILEHRCPGLRAEKNVVRSLSTLATEKQILGWEELEYDGSISS